MATVGYIQGRKAYQRPQAMLWADNPGTLTNGLYIPNGFEIGATHGSETDSSLFDQFLILSDDNRGPIDFRNTRIEKRERMINGRMRSYHIADKLTIDVNWDNLPSRSYAIPPDFNPTTGKSEFNKSRGLPSMPDVEYTTDGGAGGVEMLDWYENHKGPFWVYLAYDKYSNFGKDESGYGHLGQYNQIIEMYFSNFSYTVSKRGSNTHDLWNISVTLEEV